MGMLLAPQFIGSMKTYNIANAALFDGSTGGLTITHTTAATHSGCVRVCKFKDGVVQPVLGTSIYFNASNQLVINGLTSTSVYRDNAWYNIFWNATGAWVGLDPVTGVGTYATASIVNPKWGYDGINFSSVGLAEVTFWDGTSEALNGVKLDSATPNYVYTHPAGTPHTLLEFKNSGTMGTNSGTGGAYTVVGGISQVTSTPTNRCATWNPLHPAGDGAFTALQPTYSNGNLSVTHATGWAGTFADLYCPEKFYFRVKAVANGAAGRLQVGVVSKAEIAATPALDAEFGAGSGYWVVAERHDVLDIRKGNAGYTLLSSTAYADGDFVDVWGDLSGGDGLGKIWLGKNGVPWEGDPEAGTGASFTNVAADVIPCINGFWATTTLADFSTSSGTFKNVCTNNLPARSPKVPSTPQTGTVVCNGTADNAFIILGMAPDKAGTLTVGATTMVPGTNCLVTATGLKITDATLTGSLSYSLDVVAYTGGSNVPPANAMVNP